MGLKFDVLTIFILLSLTVNIEAQHQLHQPHEAQQAQQHAHQPHQAQQHAHRALPRVFDVTKYGAIANERTDLSPALLKAWKEACSSTGISRVMIPKGNYLLGRVELKGPCKDKIGVDLRGILKAPPDLDGDSWITFQYIERFVLFGGGTIDGQGEIAWKKNNCGNDPNCKPLPISLRLNSINDSIIQDITSVDSKNFHINVLNCHNLEFRGMRIFAPCTSVNTDGIHIGRSSGIRIFDSLIASGDDCISIGDGTNNLNITGVTCSQGHGFSIGSLGKYKDEQPVTQIYVTKCKISNTDNGVRIKSWPSLYGNTVSDLHFEDITVDNVTNPILIDQMYCPWNQCNHKEASKVRINNVSFKNIRGNCSSPKAVQLLCSSGIPCENIELNDIDIKYNGTEGLARAEFTNVKPRIITRKLSPKLAKPRPIRTLMFEGSM